MMVSPAASRSVSSLTVASVILPAGSMIQIARGGVSLATMSARPVLGLAPLSASPCTTASLRSYTTVLCPARIRRWLMLPPIRPRPTIPSSILFGSYAIAASIACASRASPASTSLPKCTRNARLSRSASTSKSPRACAAFTVLNV